MFIQIWPLQVVFKKPRKLVIWQRNIKSKWALHYAGTPVSFMANVHCAAATQNFSALEYHPEGDEIPEWTQMVQTIDGHPLIANGYAYVPDSPGLGIELNLDHIKQYCIRMMASVFASTAFWDHRMGK